MHSDNVNYHNYETSPTVTSTVKIQIEEMYLNSNETGGSFAIYGIGCNYKPKLQLVELYKCDQILPECIQLEPLVNGTKAYVECRFECLKAYKGARATSDFKFDFTRPICESFVSCGHCKERGNCILELNVRDVLEKQYTLAPIPRHVYTPKLNYHVNVLFKSQSNRIPTNGFLLDNGTVKSPLSEHTPDEIIDSAGDESPVYGT